MCKCTITVCWQTGRHRQLTIDVKGVFGHTENTSLMSQEYWTECVLRPSRPQTHPSVVFNHPPLVCIIWHQSHHDISHKHLYTGVALWATSHSSWHLREASYTCALVIHDCAAWISMFHITKVLSQYEHTSWHTLEQFLLSMKQHTCYHTRRIITAMMKVVQISPLRAPCQLRCDTMHITILNDIIY